MRGSATTIPWLATIIGLAVSMPAATEPLSFANAADRLSLTPTQRAAESQVSQAQAQSEAAKGLGRPTIDLAAQAVRTKDPIEVDFAPLNAMLQELLPGAIPLPNPVLQQDFFTAAEATLRWPLFAGGRITAAREAAHLGATAAQWGTTVANDALFAELLMRYYAVTVAQQAVDVQQELVDGLRLHDRNARSLYENDQISRTERMVAEVALAQGEQSLLSRKHALSLAQSALANLLSLTTPLDPITELTVPRLEESLGALQAAAETSNPGLKQLGSLRAQAEQGVDAAKGNYLPTVELVGVYRLASHQLPELLPRWVAGINVSVPVFDGGVRRSRVGEARAKLSEAGALHDKASQEVRLLVEQRYLAYQDAIARIEVSDRTITLTGDTLRSERLAFTEGVGRSADVIDAENAAAGAKLERLAARYEAAVAYGTLMLAAGHREQAENYFRNAPSRPSP